MKIFWIVLLVFVLSACVNGPAKTPETPTDAPTAAVADEPTATTAPTAEPATETPLPEATATEEPAATAEPVSQNTFGEIKFENKNGAAITGTGAFSDTSFAAQCDTQPDKVTLTLTVDNADIYKVNFLYRMTAIDTPLITSGWSGDAKMEALGGGKFSVDFPASQVPSKSRTWKAWLDLQFIAFDNNDVTYSSQQFTKLITYTLKCP